MPIGAISNRVRRRPKATRSRTSSRVPHAGVWPECERPLELEADALVSSGRPPSSDVSEREHERLVRDDALDDPAAGLGAVGPRHITNGQMLPGGYDLVGIVDIEPEDVLQPVVTVEAASIGAELDNPRPHLLRRHIDRDRSCPLEGRRCGQVITRKGGGDFLLGRAPALLPQLESGAWSAANAMMLAPASVNACRIDITSTSSIGATGPHRQGRKSLRGANPAARNEPGPVLQQAPARLLSPGSWPPTPARRWRPVVESMDP